MSSRDLINCVIVGMQDVPAAALLQRLYGETDSPLAAAARTAAYEMSKVLGPWPKFDIQFLPTLGAVDYSTAMGRLLPDSKNLICAGVNAETYNDACAFIKRLRGNGGSSLAVAIYDGGLASDAALTSRRLIALNSLGFDRVVSSEDDPAEIEAVMKSLVRNDAMRGPWGPPLENLGPLHIVWDFERQLSGWHIKKIYLEDDTGQKADILLTSKELSFFERLAHTPGVMVSREELIDYTYAGHNKPESEITDVRIRKIRGKISQGLVGLGYTKIERRNGPIETLWERGFLLNPHFGQNITKVAVRPPDGETPEPRAEGIEP